MDNRQIIDVRKLTPEELDNILEHAKSGAMSEGTEEYLKGYFKREHKNIWAKLINAKDDFATLIGIAKEAKAISRLEQDLLWGRKKGKEAKALLNQLQEQGRGYTEEDR